MRRRIKIELLSHQRCLVTRLWKHSPSSGSLSFCLSYSLNLELLLEWQRNFWRGAKCLVNTTQSSLKIIFSWRCILLDCMVPPWAAYGIQFRFSAFLMKAITMCYYTEEKKDWTELSWAWHKIVLMFTKASIYTGCLVPAQHQSQPYGGTEVKDFCSEFSTLQLNALSMYKMSKM